MADPLYRTFTHGASSGSHPGWTRWGYIVNPDYHLEILNDGDVIIIGSIGDNSGGDRHGAVRLNGNDGSRAWMHIFDSSAFGYGNLVSFNHVYRESDPMAFWRTGEEWAYWWRGASQEHFAINMDNFGTNNGADVGDFVGGAYDTNTTPFRLPDTWTSPSGALDKRLYLQATNSHYAVVSAEWKDAGWSNSDVWTFTNAADGTRGDGICQIAYYEAADELIFWHGNSSSGRVSRYQDGLDQVYEFVPDWSGFGSLNKTYPNQMRMFNKQGLLAIAGSENTGGQSIILLDPSFTTDVEHTAQIDTDNAGAIALCELSTTEWVTAQVIDGTSYVQVSLWSGTDPTTDIDTTFYVRLKNGSGTGVNIDDGYFDMESSTDGKHVYLIMGGGLTSNHSQHCLQVSAFGTLSINNNWYEITNSYGSPITYSSATIQTSTVTSDTNIDGANSVGSVSPTNYTTTDVDPANWIEENFTH